MAILAVRQFRKHEESSLKVKTEHSPVLKHNRDCFHCVIDFHVFNDLAFHLREGPKFTCLFLEPLTVSIRVRVNIGAPFEDWVGCINRIDEAAFPLDGTESISRVGRFRFRGS